MVTVAPARPALLRRLQSRRVSMRATAAILSGGALKTAVWHLCRGTEDHNAMHAETRQIVSSQLPWIAEGRYLDQVLSGCCGVLVVELTWHDEVRQKRIKEPGSCDTRKTVRKRDQ